ncbi:CLUMA_CG004202, isoform A [Clunio marinus]|uniref:CLUMA_CG004202, isoform A n=1 Tax=Clunio marinus TaxID=568069 RepID=A0A1J1HR26_9DIPT|nr:CLUMA_CG004202, isoform A [Clunio marinus]
MAMVGDCVSCSAKILVLRRVRDLIGIFGFIDLHFLLDICDENVPECENRLPQLGHPVQIVKYWKKKDWILLKDFPSFLDDIQTKTTQLEVNALLNSTSIKMRDSKGLKNIKKKKMREELTIVAFEMCISSCFSSKSRVRNDEVQ